MSGSGRKNLSVAKRSLAHRDPRTNEEQRIVRVTIRSTRAKQARCERFRRAPFQRNSPLVVLLALPQHAVPVQHHQANLVQHDRQLSVLGPSLDRMEREAVPATELNKFQSGKALGVMFDDPAESPNLPGVERRVGMVRGAFERQSSEVSRVESEGELNVVVVEIEGNEKLKGGQ